MGGAWGARSWCRPGSRRRGVPGGAGGWSPDPGAEGDAYPEMSCLSSSSAALSLFTETPPSPEARVGVAAEAGNMEIAGWRSRGASERHLLRSGRRSRRAGRRGSRGGEGLRGLSRVPRGVTLVPSRVVPVPRIGFGLPGVGVPVLPSRPASPGHLRQSLEFQ